MKKIMVTVVVLITGLIVGAQQRSVLAEKVLNNFVTELLNITIESFQTYNEYKFKNHREGWVFISSTAEVKDSDKIWILIDSIQKEDAVIVNEKGEGKTLEAMRLLSAGEHKINILSEGKPVLRNLIVRSIPEIEFMTLINWKFLERHKILDSINLIVDHGEREHKKHIEEWKKKGKRWIVYCGMPGYINTPASVTLEDSYQYWAEKLIKNPLVDGFLADEFGAEVSQIPTWVDAIRKLKKNFPNKEAYLYCMGPIQTEQAAKSLKSIMDALHESGGKLVLEAYLTEKPTIEEAYTHIKSRLYDQVPILEKAIPGFTRDTVLAIGTFDKFGPELNACPNVNFHVFLDMQFQFLATEPGWKDLHGIQNYLSFHQWEESQRWIAKLYRHYCIEGKTDLLSKEYGYNYILTHIQNPDFDEGEKGWIFSPATKGSMGVKNKPGLAWLQGRYDVDTHEKIPQGNNFLWTKRGKEKPNLFSQKIENLQPGKYYSVKMWVGDYNDLSLNQTLTSSIKVENADIILNKDVRWSYMLTTNAYFTYFYRVFRAKGKTAKLIISDWASDKEPDGPMNQELMYNFIEVQPYLEEELEIKSGEDTKTSEKQKKGLIGYWKFDEGEGDEVKDSSGNGNYGVVKGIEEGYTKWVDGKSGKALEFSNTNKKIRENGYIVLLDMNEYNFSKGLTVEAWIKPIDSQKGYVNKQIIGNISSLYDLGFRFRLCTSISGDVSIQFISGDGIKSWGTTTQAVIKDNVWNHVAGTYDGSVFRIYINGKEMAASAPGLTLTQGQDTLTIGAWELGATRALDSFNGIIDEVKIYNYAMTPATILKDAGFEK